MGSSATPGAMFGGVPSIVTIWPQILLKIDSHAQLDRGRAQLDRGREPQSFKDAGQ